jgi:ribosome-associated protein
MDLEKFKSELQYRFSRSSGAGGQSVNKVESKVEIYFDLEGSTSFSEEEKTMIKDSLARFINTSGIFQLVNQTERTQIGNKEKVEKRLINLINKSLIPKIKRKKTKIPYSVILDRKLEKKLVGSKKILRKKITEIPNQED